MKSNVVVRSSNGCLCVVISSPTFNTSFATFWVDYGKYFFVYWRVWKSYWRTAEIIVKVHFF